MRNRNGFLGAVMRGWTWQGLVHITASTAIVLALGGFVSPTIARAECGDYVLVGGKLTAANPADLLHFPISAKNQENSRKPCNGPMCSKGNLPAPAPVAPVSCPTQDSACLNPAD